MSAPDILALITAIEKVGETIDQTDPMYQSMVSTSLAMAESVCEDDSPNLCALKALQHA